MNDLQHLLQRAVPTRSRSSLHLDSEYRRHYFLFVLADGRIEDSRVTNWRLVEWEKVSKIILHIKGKEHVIEKHPKNHKFFMHFRQVLNEPKRDSKGRPIMVIRDGREVVQRHKLRFWTTGVCDGRTAFLIDFDFHTGNKTREYIRPISHLMGHVHPRILALNAMHRIIHP